MAAVELSIRAPTVLDFSGAKSAGDSRWFARARNFTVDFALGASGTALDASVDSESFALLPDAAATLEGNDETWSVARNSVVILPAGRWRFSLKDFGQIAVLSTANARPASSAINAVAFEAPDDEVAPVESALRRKQPLRAPQIFDMTQLQAPKDNPRLKMLQTETMSINWVDYEGERDRSALSPHLHKDFEQGSLALAGSFLHHLRVEWGKNADLWQDDRHVEVGSPSMLVVPVRMIHTTEGTGGGRHLLIDVFSPARADFIAKGWMLNAEDFIGC